MLYVSERIFSFRALLKNVVLGVCGSSHRPDEVSAIKNMSVITKKYIIKGT
jgi:hypothetical protein